MQDESGSEGAHYDLGLTRVLARMREAMEASLRGLLDSAPDAMVIVDTSGRIVLANAQSVSLFGYAREELLGKPIEVLVPERYRSGHVRYRDNFLERPATRPMGVGLELYGRRRDGSEFPVEISLSPFQTEDGLLVISAIRDTTQRRQAEEARAYLATIVQSSHDAIIGKTLDGTITSWNPAAEALYGWPASEAIGRSIAIIVPREQLAELEEILARVRAGTTVDDLETIRMTRDGERVNVSLSVSPIADASGRVVGAAAIGRDITERKRAEAERARLQEEQAARGKAEAAVKERDEFLSVAAHELKTPLAVLRGYAQLINRRVQSGGVGEPGWLVESVDIVEQHTDKLTRLVDQLLDVSRIEADRVVLELGPVDLAAAAREVVAFARTRYAGGPEIEVGGPDRLVVQGDALRLEQVLVNLLDNAIKFSPGGEPIDVELSANGADARVAVRDRGLGVDPAHRERIFDRFYQAHANEYRSGMGIGLFISRRIAELHGGSLEASFPEDGGSCFSLMLPRRIDG
jgi:PAS domain S-box-containing protein